MKVLIVNNVILPYLVSTLIVGSVYLLIDNDAPFWRLSYFLLILVAFVFQPVEVKCRKINPVKIKFWSLKNGYSALVGIGMLLLAIYFGQRIVSSFFASLICSAVVIVIMMLYESLRLIRYGRPVKTWSLFFVELCSFFYFISIFPGFIEIINK